MSMTYTTKTIIASLALAFATLTGCNVGAEPVSTDVFVEAGERLVAGLDAQLAEIEACGCDPTAPEVEIIDAATLEADAGMIPAIAQDAGGPVEELR